VIQRAPHQHSHVEDFNYRLKYLSNLRTTRNRYAGVELEKKRWRRDFQRFYPIWTRKCSCGNNYFRTQAYSPIIPGLHGNSISSVPYQVRRLQHEELFLLSV